ncbi:hypothetical protein KFZ77_16275 [Siccibacter colletis]|uniref:Uncharacterized protein n=1 Tax=Siccibacter colletis TaxID=1505757 RepID=A0ABY6JFY6_9ENTR|nr:hypothetical protein KFZ77_16275 [Siccibacter colletis]
MGITSAGVQNRDADYGGQTRARTVRQSMRNSVVHYLVSPPRQPFHDQRQAKSISRLTRREVATGRTR